MTYRPKRTKSEFEKGASGVAKVMLSKTGNTAKVIFKDGETFTVKTSECPDNLKAGVWHVQMTGDESGIFSFRPVNAVVKGKVSKFVSGENEPPTPKTSKGKFPFEYFVVILEITEPEKFSGIEVPFVLRYKFDAVEDDSGNKVTGIKGGKYGDLLDEFLMLTGAWDRGAMKFKSNVLPDLEKRILHAGKTFGFIMKDGYVDSLYSEDSGVEEGWE